MDEEERQKLIEKRKREQKERELQQDIERDLVSESRKKYIQAIRDENENKFLHSVIIFFGTLIPLYFFIFPSYYLFQILFGYVLVMVGINLDGLTTLFHIAIWTASVISVIRGKSLLDDMFN